MVNKALADKYGMECWTNIESFDRDMPIRFLPIKWEKLLLKLDTDKNHPKYWRPSVLLYAPTPDTYPLVDFCNVLKKGGLYVVGTVYENDLRGDCDEFYTLENFWAYFIGHVRLGGAREA